MSQNHLILASTSPRRKELLEKTGLEFEIVPSEYEEDMTLRLEPHELISLLSKGKAEVVARKYPDAVVIGADTFIVFKNKVMGKPHTAEKAKEMLEELNGSSCIILTGCTVMNFATNISVTEVVETVVFFKNLTKTQIDEYVATGEPIDRAGAFAIQGIGKDLIDRIEGDYDSAVGLPVKELTEILKKFGIEV